MMVTTNSTNAEKHEAFNRWYDDIDIPDVLEVPGYMRARRGQLVQLPELTPKDTITDHGEYVALYDIESDNIDKTIIKMMLAANKMGMLGRDTDLLKVVERVYYRRYGSPVMSAQQNGKGKHWLYIDRIACCENSETRDAFNQWYDEQLLPNLLQVDGIERASRYELYSVSMVYPKYLPPYLTVLEIRADSEKSAVSLVENTLGKAAASRPGDVVSKVFLYKQINDVSRPGVNDVDK